MKVLACYLVCYMMGGVSEVLFAAARDFIKGRFGRVTRKLADTSAPTRALVRFVIDSMPSIESNTAGFKSERA